MSIFDKIKKSDLANFLTLCKPYVDFDYEKAYNMALHAIKFNKGDKNSRNELRHLEELHVRWYESLAAGSPDYSVYDDPYYGLCDVWACWVIYSRKYLLAINSPKALTTKSIVSDMSVNSVIDMGNGFGYTTAGLKELFPSAKVYGFNLKDTCQYKVGEVLAPQYDFSMVSELPTTPIDLVFASEYFEHILDPVTHLLEVINKLSPKYLIVANAFGAKAVGHFDTYHYGDKRFTGKEISRIFNNTLREKGYTKRSTNMWNNRPTFWDNQWVYTPPIPIRFNE